MRKYKQYYSTCDIYDIARFHTSYFDHICGSSLVLTSIEGAQWLSGRVLDSRPTGWGCGFEHHRRHGVVSLTKTH